MTSQNKPVLTEGWAPQVEVFLEKRHRKGKKLETTLAEYIESFPVAPHASSLQYVL